MYRIQSVFKLLWLYLCDRMMSTRYSCSAWRWCSKRDTSSPDINAHSMLATVDDFVFQKLTCCHIDYSIQVSCCHIISIRLFSTHVRALTFDAVVHWFAHWLNDSMMHRRFNFILISMLCCVWHFVLVCYTMLRENGSKRNVGLGSLRTPKQYTNSLKP